MDIVQRRIDRSFMPNNGFPSVDSARQPKGKGFYSVILSEAKDLEPANFLPM